MKKLLLVLLVVTLASFLFVGCLPTTPTEGEGEGEGEAEICPTVAVTSQVAVGGKTYVKAGSQTVTITFAVPTEPVSVFVANTLKVDPTASTEVVVYANADKTVYTGTVVFAGDCDEGYIYVLTCDTCAPCKYPYKVDGVGPASEIKIASAACVCEGVTLTFKTPTQATTCGVTGVCCGDACSGFASYAIDLYTSDPFDACCDIPCVTPAYSCPGGVACDIDCELTCIAAGTTVSGYETKTYYVVATLLDNVGNRQRYYATVTVDTDSIVSVVEYPEDKNPATGVYCAEFAAETGTAVTATSTTGVVTGIIGLCK
jgi:hypothetical protein